MILSNKIMIEFIEFSFSPVICWLRAARKGSKLWRRQITIILKLDKPTLAFNCLFVIAGNDSNSYVIDQADIYDAPGGESA